MSSGACRALVAVLLTLVAATVMALPVVAKTERLNERSTVTYSVDPATGKIGVDIVIVFRNNSNHVFQPDSWGPIVVEKRANPSVPSADGFSRQGFSDLPGLWKAMTIGVPRIPAGEQVSLRIRYPLNASIDQVDARLAETPARVDDAYVYVCLPSQDTDSGSVSLEIKGSSKFKSSWSGTDLTPTDRGLKSGRTDRPADIFSCVEATREDRLRTSHFPGPAGRTIILQAWPDDSGWLSAAEFNAEPALDDIHRFLGHDIPGDGPVIIREAPPRTLGGYASAHDTPGVVQLDESGGVVDPEHELAHAWFGTDNFIELWLREGMAEWTASAMAGEACTPVEANTTGLDLSDWQVVQPTSDPDTIDEVIADQQAAACGIVNAMVSRMGEEQWHSVIGSLLDGETKYIGSSGPGLASTTRVDYREWLDAVDERGLIPAAQSDPAYAANLEDLDFAQNLLDDFGIPTDSAELVRRSEARARYHQFLADATPLGAPLAVREAMDNWEFERAMKALDKSYEVLKALQEADKKLPDAGLILFVQDQFESARNDSALDAVLNETLTLLDRATEVFEPLRELRTAQPEGWALPAAVRSAITDQRFDDIMSAITPAIAVVHEVVAADAALPAAGLLDKYRVRYENTTTANKLDELAGDAAKERRNAERTGIALNLLESEVGEWRIPAAVTDPIDNGQISTGLAIINDARAVVMAARDADLALPQAELGSEIRQSFESVTDGAEMAALRAEAEVKRDQAQAVGGALNALSSLAPDWKIPAVISTPIEERDFATAALVSSAAERWIENAASANDKLAEMDALSRTQAAFESAQTLADLEAGAALAEDWSIAASDVAEAVAENDKGRDLLADLGLWGVDVRPTLQEAIDAAVAGDVQTARNRAGAVIDTLRSASSSGSLRLAGVVFLGIAILGVLGLWLMLRREAGPPWARQSTPHWVDKGGSRWGRKKQDKKLRHK